MVTTRASHTTVMDGLWQERDLPFGSNSVQHGTAVFEGIRMYTTPAGPVLFRLDAHLERLLDSAALLGIPHAYDLAALRRHVRDAAAGSGLDNAYVRPVLYTREPRLGVNLRDFHFTLGTEIWALPPTTPRPDPYGSRCRPGAVRHSSPFRCAPRRPARMWCPRWPAHAPPRTDSTTPSSWTRTPAGSRSPRSPTSSWFATAAW
ncbi:hypothetical protein SAVCW2_74890 [Streptomyces avermitilis]|nr:hypothetical protein SAVCW2_74890 [Streptomyces avermitilis]